MRQKVRWNIEMSIALFFEKLFFPLFIGVCGQFCRATENATKKNFAVALSHSTFAAQSDESLGATQKDNPSRVHTLLIRVVVGCFS